MPRLSFGSWAVLGVLLLFAAGAFTPLISADQKPLVVNQTSGRTEQLQTGNNLVVPTAAFVGVTATLPSVGLVRIGDTNADFIAPFRMKNNQNSIEFYNTITGTSGASFGLANAVFVESTNAASNYWSAYNGNHIFSTGTSRTPRLTIGDNTSTFPGTTASTTQLTGTVIVGNGVSGTTVGIGGGNINAGGLIYSGGSIIAGANSAAASVGVSALATNTQGSLGAFNATAIVDVTAYNATGASLTFTTTTSGGATVERARITTTGNFIAGNQAALATTATNGFLYIPTCAGTPTGVPTAITGMAPMVINTTNNKLYFYSGGAWRDAGP